MHTFKILSGIILLLISSPAPMVTMSRSRSGVGRTSDVGVGFEDPGVGWSSPGGMGLKGISFWGRRPSPL